MKLQDYDNAENTNIDFKEQVEYSKNKSWIKSVSAFVNTNDVIILFGIKDVEQIFKVKKSRASEIIAKLLKTNLIKECQNSKYRFKK